MDLVVSVVVVAAAPLAHLLLALAGIGEGAARVGEEGYAYAYGCTPDAEPCVSSGVRGDSWLRTLGASLSLVRRDSPWQELGPMRS